VALLPKKRKKVWVWLSYSRSKQRVIACEVCSRSAATLKRLWDIINLLKPAVVCTDEYKEYRKVIPANLLIKSKKYTHNIEAQNSSLRDFIKRFNRKTKAYSKALDMIGFSLYIHFFYKTMFI
jgi:IS1 family transposase